MKKSLILAGLLLVSTSGLMASDSGFYVGIDIGNTDIDGKYSLTIPSSPQFYEFNDNGSFNDDGGSQTLKVGYYMDKNSRVYASYQNIRVEGGDAYSAGLGYDYLIGDNALKPFIGVLGGYTSIKDDEGTDENTKGMYYGVQAGLNYAVNQNISLEAGYRYMKANIDSTFVDSDGVNTVEVDTIKNWFIGANYKF